MRGQPGVPIHRRGVTALLRRQESEKRSAQFCLVVKGSGLPAPTREFRFAPPRWWRFDYAWPESKVALEVEGGVFTKGRHTRGAGYAKDMVKYSEAAALGWRLIRVQPSDLCTATTLDLLRRALTARSTP